MSEVRLIDANELLKKKIHYGETEYYFDHYAVQIEDIENAPTIDAELIRHGHWEVGWYLVSTSRGRRYTKASVCSCCHQQSKRGRSRYSYCPNCGAKMDEVTE